MKKDTTVRTLFNEPKYFASEGRPQLLRIEFAADYTKVDFGHQATNYYIKGGWVRIAKETFIRIQSAGERLTMTAADNIPIAPVHHNFNTSKDWLYFSLYFPGIDLYSLFQKKSIVKLDLIEAEPGDKKDFNYLDIIIDSKKGIELV